MNTQAARRVVIVAAALSACEAEPTFSPKDLRADAGVTDIATVDVATLDRLSLDVLSVRDAGDARVITDLSDVSVMDAPLPFDIQPIDRPGVDVPRALVPARGVSIRPPFDSAYQAFELGMIPGIPMTRYGGCIIDRADRNRLLIGVDSELASGSLWAVRVLRDGTQHIVAWDGVATRVATTPYIDANLFYDTAGNLLYTQWPVSHLGLLAPGAVMPSQDIALTPLGITDSPGGMAFVPAGFTTAGTLRALGWPARTWYSLELADRVPSVRVENVRRVLDLPAGGSGGIAFVPPGSPEIARRSIVVAEWSTAVAFYEVNENADPLPATRREFLAGLENAWGAYFEPVTGDFMFPSWGNNRFYIIQGFQAPP